MTPTSSTASVAASAVSWLQKSKWLNAGKNLVPAAWRLRLRQRVPLWFVPHAYRQRRFSARLYLRGQGIEIGALHLPLPLPRGAHARYVDSSPVQDVRAKLPELRAFRLVEVDILDRAETLANVADASCDFVIANHVLEHVEEPVGTLQTWLRVLRPNGVIFFIVPEAGNPLDGPRPATSPEHLLRDHALGPQGSLREHYEEWARLVEKMDEKDVPASVAQWTNEARNIHFHVWSMANTLRFLLLLQQDLTLPFQIEFAQRNFGELIFVLRKNHA